jgi:tellurite resistance-related uncharacterized protein
MKRLVTQFEKRDFGQYLKLDCLHTINTDASVTIGDEIECLQCDALTLPFGLKAYKKTPIFDQQTVPKGFRRAHSTKEGVWATINVLSGRVRYVVDDIESMAFELNHQTKGVIAPEVLHHLELTGEVQLYVEFYKDEDPS